MPDHQQDPDGTRNAPAIPPTVVHRGNDADDYINPRVAEILDDYFDKLQAGEAPTVAGILAAHPEHAEELAACLDGIHLVHDATADPGSPLKSMQTVGDFRIIREVGRGGMGVVYEAEQISLKRRVALKVLRYMVADREAMERFQREAETVASLHHSNIVPIFAVGEAEGVNYFAMQFIEGESLADIQQQALDDQTSFDSHDIANWGLQVAEALDYAHDHEIIHRDVKPSNLIRDEEGRIWLTDFGLAKRLDDVQLSMTGAILGTPRYMSPEQANSVKTPVDHRTDIYSLGATLYEFATGKPLFDAKSTHAALGSILSEDPIPPRSVRPSLPRDLETIIMRCLSKDAVHRYDSATELVTDLRAFIDGRPINARRPSVVEKLGRWLQKHQRQVTTAVTAAAIAALLLIGTRVAIQEQRESQLGRIQIESTRKLPSPVVATILAKDGTPVVPSITLPTQQLVEVPRGDYELQLQSDGELTDHYRLSVYPSVTPRLLETYLEDRNLWKPAEITGEWAIWHREDGDDIVVFDDDGVTLLDAATKDTIWRSDLHAEPSLQETSYYKTDRWRWRPERDSDANFYDQPAIVVGELDCDQDGSQDLVLACRYHPMVVALSGSTGQLLWRSDVEPKEGQANTKKTVRGTPLMKDLNGDNVPDLIACFMTGGSSSTTKSHCHLRALDGTNGSTLWQQLIDPKLHTTPNAIPYAPFMSKWFLGNIRLSPNHVNPRHGKVLSVSSTEESESEHRGIVAPFPLQFVPSTDDEVFLLCVGSSLLRVDAKSGRVMATDKLPEIPVRAPQWIDADSDGTSELLICLRNLVPPNQSRVSVRESPALRLVLWDVKNATAIWTRDIIANWEWGISTAEIAARSRAWPLIRDLDGDGKSEILLSGDSTAGDDSWTTEPYGHLQLLNPSTGEPKWKSAPVVNTDCQLSYFAIVDDIDDDGTKDVATASRFVEQPKDDKATGKSFSIYVDVFSGKDGTRIRRLKSITRTASQAPVLHGVQSRVDGLLIELRRASQHSADHALSFDLRTGVCQWTLNDVRRLLPIKVDSISQAIIGWTQEHPSAGRGGTLRVFQQQAALATPAQRTWKYADQMLTACGDVNGDGVDDAIGAPDDSRHFNMVSGSSGKYLWSEETAFSIATPTMSDFDSDGAPDIIASINTDQQRHTKSPIALISGRTGKTLWRSRLSKEVEWSQQRFVIDDMNGDGQIDVLIFAKSNYYGDKNLRKRWGRDIPWVMFCFDGKSGRLLSSSLLGEAGNGSSSKVFGSFQETTRDIDGDAIRDIVGYGVDAKGMLMCQAISGANGSTLWSGGKLAIESPATNRSDYPHFCCFPGAQPTIISAATTGYQSGGTGPGRQRLIVKAIDAASGNDSWEWTTPMYFKGSSRGDDRETMQHGTPVPLHVRTEHGSRLGIWHTNKSSVDFSLLKIDDKEGTSNRVAESFRIYQWKNNGPDWSFIYDLRVWAEDLDGDELDELIYSTPTNLIAYSITNERELWSRPFSERSRINSVERLKSGQLEIRYQTKDEDGTIATFTALNGNGEVVWNDTIPDEAKSQFTYPDTLRLANDSCPKLLYHFGNRTTVCRPVSSADRLSESRERPTTTLLAKADTGLQMAAGIFDVSAATDPRLLRPGMSFGEFGSIAKPMLLSVLIIFAPLLYILLLMRGRWTLKVLMLAPLVTAMVVFGLRWPDPMIPAHFSGGLMSWNLHRAFFFAMTIAPSGAVIFMSAKRIMEQRWRSLLQFFAAVIVCGVACLAINVLLEHINRDPTLAIRYDWSNSWLWALAIGLHFCGILLICWQIGQVIWLRLLRRSGKMQESMAQ